MPDHLKGRKVRQQVVQKEWRRAKRKRAARGKEKMFDGKN